MQDFISYGTPYRTGDLVAIDVLNIRQAWTYDLGPDASKTLTWTQQRHSSSRYIFQRSPAGAWTVQRISLSHSNPSYHERPYSSGTVIWKEGAIELVETAVDAYLEAGGKMREAPLLSRRRYETRNGRLVVDATYQYFEFAKAPGPGEVTLPIPDFDQELTQEFEIHYRSRERGISLPPGSEGLLLDVERGPEITSPVMPDGP